jgi:1-acyl-sn-glycerol-3-phosphate acyltransferase
MPSALDSHPETPAVRLGYRFFRGLIRLWFGFFFRKIRLLRGGAVPASGAVMLVVSHPASFLDALILVAALERQVRCLLNKDLLRGFLRSRLARWLGMIPYEPEGAARAVALRGAREALGRREAVVVFAEHEAAKSGEFSPVGQAAATLAVEAEAQHAGQLQLRVFPVHMYLPVGRSQSSELLIYVNSPLSPKEFLSAGAGDLPARRFATALEEALEQNAFRLQPGDIRQFLADLEEVLRTDLEEEWAAWPHSKQKAEGFTLSEFIVGWVEQLNFLNPGRLVALRDDLDAYREERRRWVLRQAEVEAGGAWLQSSVLCAWYWLESLFGLPIAVYGLANHLLVWLLLFWGGLLKRESGRDRTLEWLLRAGVVLGCYAAQIVQCAHRLGRATAGYYALTLPLSGAFLWRYEWLLRARTRLLFLAARLGRQSEKLRQLRKRFVEDLNRARDAYADTLGLPH